MNVRRHGDGYLMAPWFLQAHFLQKAFNVLKHLLSFDIVSRLPLEIAKIIFSYLDAQSLCIASECCWRWREIANTDSLWQRLCLLKDYTRLAYIPASSSLKSPSVLSEDRPLTPSPHSSPDSGWKQVYIRAYTLHRNWREGRLFLPPLLRGHSKPVTTIACDNNTLVSGSADTSVRIWSLATYECVHVLEGHTDAVNEVALMDGFVVTACSDGLIRVYDMKNGQFIKSLHGHSGSVEHVTCNNQVILSGGSDSLIKVWEKTGWKLRHTLNGHTDEIEVRNYDLVWVFHFCVFLSVYGLVKIGLLLSLGHGIAL